LITDRIENLALYKSLYPQISELIDYVKANDIGTLSAKLNYKSITIIPITSDKVAVGFDPQVLEAHRKLMDIHITLKGVDVMAYSDIENESILIKDYDQDNDYLLAKSDKIKLLSIPENYFCIVPNNFAHMALYEGHTDVKKIVIKLVV
jgi:YhcH/YjgK/YiaL family protein